MRTQQFRELFPILAKETTVNGKPLVYFDNAATAQRPKSVTDVMDELNLKKNANIHRAVHTLAVEATDAFETARDVAGKFLNAAAREEIIFTSGDTAAINLVAFSFGEAFVKAGDEIIVGEAEHHSNIVPWQLMAQRKGAHLVWLRMDDDGLYDLSELENLITSRTRIACIGHASNVLGVLNPIKEIAAVCHAHNVPVLIDGAQGAVHTKVDVQDIDCDFYTFSAHKLCGPTGVGVLYGRKALLEQMPPYMGGGDMIASVSLEKTTFAALPFKFEAGTQNIANVAALVPALELMDKMLNDKELNSEFKTTVNWLAESLKGIEGLTLYGAPAFVPTECRLPVFSFTVDGIHHEDMALLLDKMGIEVRSGQMCTGPLMDHFGVSGMLRVSLLPYNTLEEAQYFIESLKRVIKMLK